VVLNALKNTVLPTCVNSAGSDPPAPMSASCVVPAGVPDLVRDLLGGRGGRQRGRAGEAEERE
jgi:hypothetical protein